MALEHVTVACKLPAGLVATILEDPTVIDLPNGQSHLIPGKVKASFTFTGSAEERRLESEGTIVGETTRVVAGYGLTSVPKDFTDAWFEQNKTYAPVARGLIFAVAKPESARDKAKDGKSITNGLEPMKPPPAGKPVDGVETMTKD